jgi:hypothetical protein
VFRGYVFGGSVFGDLRLGHEGTTTTMVDLNTPTETFVASRWTKGNLFFPTRIFVGPLRVSRIKPRLFGSNEESISIGQVASVHIATRIIWSDIVIESSAGTDPLTSHGHRKADAQRIRDLIESYQAASHAGTAPPASNLR